MSSLQCNPPVGCIDFAIVEPRTQIHALRTRLAPSCWNHLWGKSCTGDFRAPPWWQPGWVCRRRSMRAASMEAAASSFPQQVTNNHGMVIFLQAYVQNTYEAPTRCYHPAFTKGFHAFEAPIEEFVLKSVPSPFLEINQGPILWCDFCSPEGVGCDQRVHFLAGILHGLVLQLIEYCGCRTYDFLPSLTHTTASGERTER